MLIHLILIRQCKKLKSVISINKKILLLDSFACRRNSGKLVLHDVLSDSHSVPENVVVPGDGAQVKVELLTVCRAQRRQQTDDVVGVARPLVGGEISQTLHRSVHFFLQFYKSAREININIHPFLTILY
jgi:hypothetical protein